MTLIGHKKQWEFLTNKFTLGQLSHAYLFTGAEGIGKKTFAIEFVEFINCKFPDSKIISKKEDKTEIDISQIREAQNFLSYKSYNGGFKVVIIDDAHLMNQEAQSCFLKTLEEPKGKTLLIIISSKPDMLLPTIISRCQTLKFLRPKDLPQNPEKIKKDEEILKEIIPILNSSFAEKFKYVKAIDFQDQKILDILEVIQRHLRDVLMADYGNKKVIKILNLIEDLNNKLLFTNASPKLALEILLMEF